MPDTPTIASAKVVTLDILMNLMMFSEQITAGDDKVPLYFR